MSLTETSTIVDELGQTVATIFQTMIGMEVAPHGGAGSPTANRLAATVHFSGSWSGVLLLEMDPLHACRIAARFLSMETPAAVDDDVRDVLGELANMIGGNLKGSLSPGALLSIPEVIDGSDVSIRICAKVCARQLFSCDEGVFRVSLIQTPPNPI